MISTRRPDIELINKTKRKCCQQDFAVPVKNKGSEKMNKYLNLATNVMETQIVAGALGTPPKGLGKKFCGI